MENKNDKLTIGNAKIKLLKHGGKTGRTILKSDYELISSFILELLESGGGLTLLDLLDKCKAAFAHRFGGDPGWHVLNIKQDLQAKGLIQSKTDTNGQIVSLKKQIDSPWHNKLTNL